MLKLKLLLFTFASHLALAVPSVNNVQGMAIASDGSYFHASKVFDDESNNLRVLVGTEAQRDAHFAAIGVDIGNTTTLVAPKDALSRRVNTACKEGCNVAAQFWTATSCSDGYQGSWSFGDANACYKAPGYDNNVPSKCVYVTRFDSCNSAGYNSELVLHTSPSCNGYSLNLWEWDTNKYWYTGGEGWLTFDLICQVPA